MEQDGSAQARQRAQTPANGLTRLGHIVRTSSVTLHPRSPAFGREIRGLDRDGRSTSAREAEIVVMRLVDQDESASIRAARDAGQIIVFDWDDDVWHLPEWNPARRLLKRSGRYIYGTPLLDHPTRSIDLDCLEANMAACDAVIASTPPLARVIRDVLDERDEPCPQIFVCRNGIVPELYRPTPEHNPLRVGWAGSIDYLGDSLRTIAPVLVEVMSELDDDRRVEFWHLGTEHHPQEVDQILGPVTFPIQSRPWVPAREFPRVLEEIDVAVIPRLACAFTESQSAMTGLSMAAAGVPFIATATSEYLALAQTGVGFTASSPDDWRNLLNVLLRSARLRASSRGRALEVVVADHGPIATARHYVDVFERIQRVRAA